MTSPSAAANAYASLARLADPSAGLAKAVGETAGGPSFGALLKDALGANVVALGRMRTDSSDFRLKYEPGHPSADANGNVKYPNVNSLIEMTDMREAQRSYEANINVIGATRRMIQRTIDILKA